MESEPPKIQIRKVAALQIVSFLCFIFGIFLFALLVGVGLAIFGNAENAFVTIVTAIIFALFPIGFFSIFFVIFYPIGLWSLSKISYGFGKDVLTIRGGIIARYEKNLLFSKIQHVVITQGFWERMFGISNLIIQTAGNDVVIQQGGGQNQQLAMSQPVIPAIFREDAEMLKEKIISRVGKFKGQGL